MLPAVMRYNESHARAKLARVGQALTGRPTATADDAAEAVESLLRDFNLPLGLAGLDIPSDHLPRLAKDGLLAGAVKTNPRPVNEPETLELLKQAIPS
jgi:alcohol dehydrogenase